ncbi:hypothetical protein BH11PLA1_BH11PLA1_17090 [soil metagenome]
MQHDRFPRLTPALAAFAPVACALCLAQASESSAAGAAPVRRGVVSRGGMMLNHAMTQVALKSADPSGAMSRLRWNVEFGHGCYTDNTASGILALDLQKFGLRPVSEGPLGQNGTDFLFDTKAWMGGVPFSSNAVGNAGQGKKADLRYSFPSDGVLWGSTGAGPNVLAAALKAQFGDDNLDQGREYIRQSLAAWRRHGGLTYTEVSDNNVAWTTTTIKNLNFGEIRIGGVPLGGPDITGILAYNNYPAGGGDMLINTSYFLSENNAFAITTNNYRYLRNTVAHEHGHGLGYQHTVPCVNLKLMEPFESSAYDMLSVDEKRGAGRNYGDRYSGNTTAALAKDFGNLTTPNLRSVIARDLSTNGTTGLNSSNQDWFRFTIDSARTVTITATPTGGTYANDAQTTDCTAPNPPTSINATQAGNLTLRIWNAAGTTQIAEAALGGVGAAETLVSALVPGTYCVQVIDDGPDANQVVQLYDLTIRIPTSLANPDPIAGINKRILAGMKCFFDGRPNSKATEAGATITRYDWDLDNDGIFETQDTPAPNKTYFSNGLVPVTLKVTDSNGRTGTDSINVTVYGATTTVTNVAPGSGRRDSVVPVVLTVTNALAVTNSSQVFVTGGSNSPVTVTGTPVVSIAGTRIDGLSFHIPADASLGNRSVVLTNSDGLGTSGFGLNVFSVSLPVCAANIADDAGNIPPVGPNSGVNEGDYNAFFNTFFTNQAIGSPADIATDAGLPLPSTEPNNGVNEGDYNLFFNVFFSGC